MNKKELLTIGISIAFLFGTSLGMSFFSSYFLSNHGYNFMFPLLYFSLHHLTHFILASMGIWYFRKPILHEQAIESPLPYITREKIGSPVDGFYKKEQRLIENRVGKHRIDRILFPIYQFLNDIGVFNVWIIVCCLIGTVDSGLSGFALCKISLPFYTMLKSSTPIFILFARFVFQLERPSLPLILTIVMIASGISLAAKSDTIQFHLKYALLVLGSCFMAGFRWGFLEYFIKRSSQKNDSILHSLSVLSLLSGVFLLIGFFLFEGLLPLIAFEKFSSAIGVLTCFSLIAITGVVGFIGCLSEFLVISKTNVMVSSVVLITKEIFILGISVKRNTLVLSNVNILGVCISIIGILLFTFRSMLFPGRPVESHSCSSEETLQARRYIQSPVSPTENSPIALKT
ncbi:solute carrier family 35, member C2 [Nematocida parisii]|nr:solute carrier family 35, member C2 [Nematocida parisii]KAI5127828.1 solute carrier family 35, member C2 [Nematocida parisii]KAI5141656.1 solute carrier family 35, member C2 [Nematocida parisii]